MNHVNYEKTIASLPGQTPEEKLAEVDRLWNAGILALGEYEFLKKLLLTSKLNPDSAS